MPKLSLIPDGTKLPIAVEWQQSGSALNARVGESHIEACIEDGLCGGRVLRIGHRLIPFHAIRKGAQIEVWAEGKTYRFELADTRTRKGDSASGPVSREISAPMPGTVLRIEIRAGDVFAAHQPLIIMESMKMEMTLSAPHEGRVQQVLCKAGELVPMGKVLLTLEPAKEHANVPA